MGPKRVAHVELETAIRQGLRVKSGSDFQSTAQDILRQRLPGFVPIVPHGRDGDGGNDGYSKAKGIYTQIYAPDKLRLPGREAAHKAVADFAKMQRCWSKSGPLREFWFVTNAPGSNIHVERALSDIHEQHGVQTRFVGTAELAEQVLALPSSRIEALMGFTMGKGPPDGSKDDTIDVLTTLTVPQLLGLHQLAALVYPVPPELCEQLLPSVTDWHSLWPWLRERGFAKEDSHLVELDQRVMEQCRKNAIEQREACARWVEPLLNHGSTDCLYLAVLPLLKLGRLTDACRIAIRSGWECVDSGWAKAISRQMDLLEKRSVVAKLSASDQQGFRLARANLFAQADRHKEALALYEQCLRAGSAWPRHMSKGIALLNCGVSAHHIGLEEVAHARYEEAIGWARRKRDDWTLGRAGTNLAQLLVESDRVRAASLIAEAEVAKRRIGDNVGLVGIAMAKGLLAVKQSAPELAHQSFAMAYRLAKRHGASDTLADICFNLGKTSGEMRRWRRAVGEYRRSLSEATALGDLRLQSRARVGLSESLFMLGEWSACERECRALARLPAEAAWSSLRLTGLHGIIALQLRVNGTVSPGDTSRALTFARTSGEEEWLGRVLVDVALGRSGHTTPRRLETLLKSGAVEANSGRLGAALYVYRSVWQFCLQSSDDHSAIQRRASTLLDRVLLDRRLAPAVAIACLKWRYEVYLHLGRPQNAIDVLQRCARRAWGARMWDDYCRAVEQQAITLAELGRNDATTEALHRDALQCATRHHLQESMRIASGNLAECLRQRGRTKAAHRASLRCLTLCESEQNPAAYVAALHNHYLIERDSGRKTAKETLRRCEVLAKRYGLQNEIVRAKLARGLNAWAKGDLKEAATYFRRVARLRTAGIDPQLAADARYNLALVLKETGRIEPALRLFDRGGRHCPIDLQGMRQADLIGQLLEESGSLSDAAEAWRGAAAIAETLGDLEKHAEYTMRVRFLTGDTDRLDRMPYIRRAERLLKAIYHAKLSVLQRRYDDAVAFCDKHSLVQYQMHANHAFAKRLASTRRSAYRVVAAQASIASLMLAIPDPIRLRWATEQHVHWLIQLEISRPTLKRLRDCIRAWLEELLKHSPSVIPLLLAGFDVVLQPYPKLIRDTSRATN